VRGAILELWCHGKSVHLRDRALLSEMPGAPKQDAKLKKINPLRLQPKDEVTGDCGRRRLAGLVSS
jgi:hypothetical protein